MDTGLGHSDDAELLLVVTVPEFTKEENSLLMDFAVDCPLDACRYTTFVFLHLLFYYFNETSRKSCLFTHHPLELQIMSNE